MNDLLADVEPLGRIFFEGLWCHADREGRLVDRGKKLKAEILPYDDCDVENLMQQLEDRDFIQRYTVNQVPYIQVVTFSKHQNPHVKEPASIIPAPPSPNLAPYEPVLAPENPASTGLIPLTLNPITLTGEPQSDANPPLELLDQYQITPKLIEDLDLPYTKQNYQYAVAAVACAKREIKGTAHDAYLYILQQASISRADGWSIDCFWLNDAKFFPRNRIKQGVKSDSKRDAEFEAAYKRAEEADGEDP